MGGADSIFRETGGDAAGSHSAPWGSKMMYSKVVGFLRGGSAKLGMVVVMIAAVSSLGATMHERLATAGMSLVPVPVLCTAPDISGVSSDVPRASGAPVQDFGPGLEAMNALLELCIAVQTGCERGCENGARALMDMGIIDSTEAEEYVDQCETECVDCLGDRRD